MAATSCGKHDVAEGAEEAGMDQLNPQLTGVWKVIGFRMAGANMMNFFPVSYLLTDVVEGQAVLMTKDPSDESGGLLCQKMELKGDGSEFTLDALVCP